MIRFWKTYCAMVLRQMLPWQMKSTFIINENPPKTLVYAPFCRSLPTLFLPFRLLILSQNKQNRARRGKLKSSNVVEIRVGYHCCFLPYTANFYSDKLYFCSLILKASFPPSRISQTCSRIPY